jgi:predicted Zn-dependent protease
MRSCVTIVLLCAISSPSSGGQQTAVASTSTAPNLLLEAQTAYRSGRFPEAIEKYNQVRSADPKSAEAYAGLIRVYIQQNNVPKADDTARQGLAAVPDAKVFQTALGELYAHTG